METKEYKTIDKTAWKRGAWDHEPDKRQWTDEATGYPCLIVRGPSGALCGYVGVSNSHPCYRADYSSEPCQTLDAHGGLTFSDRCQEATDECTGICHKPAADESDDVWWLGFDCAHSGDLCPAHSRFNFLIEQHERYRGISYVTNEVQKLASQLKSLET